jgi:Holliday junction DNA helicase RuvB
MIRQGAPTPLTLDEFIGQDQIVTQIRTAILAAKRRMALDELWAPDLCSVFHGPPGLGKSLLGQIIAHELNVKWFVVLGNHLSNAAAAREWLTRIARSGTPYVWIVDEADSAKAAALQELHLSLTEGKYLDDNGAMVTLPPLVFCFTTNYLASIPLALQSRCVAFGFAPYSAGHLATIAEVTAERLGYDLSADAAVTLAENAQGEPRRVNSLLRLIIQDLVAHDRDIWITADDVVRVIAPMLHALGLTGIQIELMQYLARQKNLTAGLQTLAHAISQSPNDLRQHHEHFLIRSGLITVVPGGRQLTSAGAAYLEAHASHGGQPGHRLLG